MFRSAPGRALVALLGAVSLVGCLGAPVPPADSQPTSGPMSPGAGNARPAHLPALLTALTDARTDAVAWSGLMDHRAAGWAQEADRLRANVSQLEVTLTPTGRTHAVSEQRRRILGDTARVHAVRAAWAVPGTTHAEHTIWLTVTSDRRGLRLAGLGDGPPEREPEPLWAIDAVRVARGDGAIALTGGGVDPGPWLDAMERSRTEIARLHPGVLVAQLPGTAADFERVLGVRTGSHRRVAAGSWPFGAAVHLVVNPSAGGATTGAARQVLVTHEAVHLVTGSVRGQRPLWLTEGYADLIALHARPAVAAAHEAYLAGDQRRHGIATALVTDRELAPTDPRVHAHYQRAWVTVRVLDRGAGVGDRSGTGVADRVHTAVLDGTPLAEALAAEGWSEAALADAVAVELRRLAG